MREVDIAEVVQRPRQYLERDEDGILRQRLTIVSEYGGF
jgi:hypothetical protein